MNILLHSLWAFIGALGFGILFNIRGKNLFLAALGGSIGYAAYLLISHFVSFDILSHFLAAVVFSVYAEFMAVARKTPVTIFLVPSMMPFVPGASIFYTMQNLVVGNSDKTWYHGLRAFQVAGAIAMGVITVSFAVRIWRLKKGKQYIKN